MKSILWHPTMKCNLSCSYCHFRWTPLNGGYAWSGYDRQHLVKDQVSPKEYIRFFERMAPFHLEISGGEPLLYRGFREVIAALPGGCTWAITSNTLLDVENIDFGKCKHWTASYHDVDEPFLTNLSHIHIWQSVSFVVPFKRIEQILRKAREYKERGFSVNILRELNPGVDWRGTKEWQALLSMKEIGCNVVEDDIPPSYDFDSGYICKGGNEYFAIMPDGSIYRCYTMAMLGEPLGKIRDFEPSSIPYECHQTCLACAKDVEARMRRIIDVA